MPRRDLVLLMAAMLLVTAGVVWQSYTGRAKLRNDTVRGCVRSQQDRRGLQKLNTDVSRFADDAAAARRADGNAVTADRYALIARRAEDRTLELAERLPPKLSCDQAFPHPSLLPWAG
jgi:hypothetical protein